MNAKEANDLNERIALEVMGWNRGNYIRRDRGLTVASLHRLWIPAESVQDAWQVLEHLRTRSPNSDQWWATLKSPIPGVEANFCCTLRPCHYEGPRPAPWSIAKGETMAEAICKAAVGIDDLIHGIGYTRRRLA